MRKGKTHLFPFDTDSRHVTAVQPDDVRPAFNVWISAAKRKKTHTHTHTHTRVHMYEGDELTDSSHGNEPSACTQQQNNEPVMR